MTPDEYCQQRTAQSGTSFYYSFLFLPPERRRAITALYAFCREVDDVVDETSDPELARTKLAWWRREIGAVFSGTPQHPVALALRPVVAAYRLPQEHFQTVIDGMAMDLERNRYLDFADLERYCHWVAGVVGLMSAEIFGYANPATLPTRATSASRSSSPTSSATSAKTRAAAASICRRTSSRATASPRPRSSSTRRAREWFR